MTNLEWIRSLPADQLAEFLDDMGAVSTSYCDGCPKSEGCKGGICEYDNEKDVWLKWLKSEIRVKEQ